MNHSINRDYFNLGRVSLTDLSKEWAAADARFAAIHPYFPGARMLRQDPLECLFSFICSQNNHILRIHAMVEKLCSTYGSRIDLTESEESGGGAERDASRDAAELLLSPGKGGPLGYFAFPTLDELARTSDEELR